MITNQNQNNSQQQLRREFKQQQSDGISTYHQFLEHQLAELQRENVLLGLGADTNFELWKKSQSDNERITATLDSVRSWLDEKGYSLAVRVIDGMLD